MTQGDFLESMGIKQRANILSSNSEAVNKAVERLINKDQMGKIYKVLEFSRK
jgi:SAM-dependent MidA family methyltransferase